MGLLDILKQYADPGAQPSRDVLGHFDTVAQQASPTQLGGGIAAALRSDATPGIGQVLGSLFGQSNPVQKAGPLNEILQSLGPAGAATAGGGLLGRILGGVGSNTAFTPAQAAQVSPSDLSTLATAAHEQDDSLVDRVGSFYAMHPTLVKTLGAAALGVAMSHMSQHV